VCGAVCQEGYYPDKPAHINQDAMATHAEFCGRPGELFMGVFDGHGPYGDVASTLAKELVPMHMERLHSESHDQDEVGADFEQAFLRANSEILAKMGEQSNFSGTTGIAALLIDDVLHVANVGDSRAIMGKALPGASQWKVVPLSIDQTAFRDDERQRCRADAQAPVSFATMSMIEGDTPMSENFGEESIEAAADPPRVWLEGKMCPGTAFTRSLGDAVAKLVGVVAKPELCTVQLTENAKAIVLASDGVFEFMENEEVLAVAQKYAPDATAAANEMVKISFNRWMESGEERTDDITAVVCYLEGFAAPASKWDKVRQYALPNFNNRPASKFGSVVLDVLKTFKHYGRDLHVQQLFPNFDWSQKGIEAEIGTTIKYT